MAEMTWPQLRAWMDYSRVEPFGAKRADLRAGIIASTIANVNSVNRTFTASDFMPDYGTSNRKPLTDPEEWRATLESAAIYSNTSAMIESQRRWDESD